MTEDSLVHRVCQYLQDEVEIGGGQTRGCQKCPLEIDTPYGKAVQGCVLRAKNLIEMVRSEAS